MGTTDHLLSLGQQARADGRLDDARKFFAEAAALSRDHGQTLALVDSLKGVGRIERDSGNFDLALASYEEAAAICRSEGQALRLAHTLRHVGDILAQQGNVVAAHERCQDALQIYREHGGGQPLDVANAIRSVALVTEQFNDSETARPLWEEAKGLYASVHVWAGVEECDAHLVSN
jgi:tetratricopeptide (TPR) repeat protein